MKKLLLVFLIVILALSLVLSFVGCEQPEEKEPKKAIIWVTALIAGAYYDSTDMSPVWDPIDDDLLCIDTMLDQSKLGSLISGILMDKNSPILGALTDLIGPIMSNTQDKTNLFWRLSLDENGDPLDPTVTPATDPMSGLYYGAARAYKKQVETIEEIYGSEYEVKVFTYDWRLDLRDSGKELEKFINDNQYDEVVLMAHSMGGAVVSNYLARSESNRNKVKGYLSMGGTLAGSFDTWQVMEDPSTYLGMFMKNLGLDLSGILSTIDKDGQLMNNLAGQLSQMAISTYTFPQLCPTWALLQSAHYGNGTEGIVIDGTPISSEDELMAFYATRPWAWQRDSKGDVVYDNNGKPVVRKVVQELKDYQHSLYVTDEKGNEVIATSLVNSYYLFGMGVDTLTNVDVTTVDGKQQLTFHTTKQGDMQVLLHSLIENQDPDQLIEDRRLIYIPNSNHYSVGCSWEVIKGEVVKFLDSLSQTKGAEILAEMEAEE